MITAEALTKQLGSLADFDRLPPGVAAAALAHPDDVIVVDRNHLQVQIENIDLEKGYAVYDQAMDPLYSVTELEQPGWGYNAFDAGWLLYNDFGTMAYVQYSTESGDIRNLIIIRGN